MRHTMQARFTFVFALGLAFLGGGLLAEAKMVPKIKNFILFPDQSGSMYARHGETNDDRMVVAKKAMRLLNKEIPLLDYKAALTLFAPYEDVAGLKLYDRATVGAAIDAILEGQGMFGRQTPMGPDIEQLGDLLKKTKGKTAVIVLSDGDANKGDDPIEAAKARYQDNSEICFHVISFSESAWGKRNNDGINALTNKCAFIPVDAFINDAAARDAFIKEVFYTVVEDEKPVVVAPPPADDDHDGVVNADDSCPGSPMGAKVDKDGCWVLRGVNFDSNKATLTAASYGILDDVVEVLKQNPGVKLEVQGHTDSRGAAAHNQKLSGQRAKAVRDHLVESGIPAGQLTAKGYGESSPIASNETAEGRAENRRVEMSTR